MAPVPWVTLDGAQFEQIIGVLLCRRHVHATRIRPSQGDGGVDVYVPNGDGTLDVYQAKAYSTNLTAGQKTKIKTSLATAARNADIAIRD
jgi:hypothetical protein